MDQVDGVPLLESERAFSVRTYTVSHAMLLLRSVKTEVFPTRVDVLFVGVEHIEIPSKMNQLRITGEGHYVLAGQNWNGTVKALNCAVKEDRGEYFDPSPFHAGSGI